MLLYVIALFALLHKHGIVNGASCCVNTSSGNNFDQCSCLSDNILLKDQLVRDDERLLYHWVLTNVDLIMSEERGKVTFWASPCNGSLTLELNSASPSSWNLLPTYRASNKADLNAITTEVRYSEHAAYIYANGTSDVSFEIAAVTSVTQIPRPGGGGRLSINVVGETAVEVVFNASVHAAGETYLYRVYWRELPETSSTNTNITTTTSSNSNIGSDSDSRCNLGSGPLKDNPYCIFWTPCGIERNAQDSTGWLALPSATLNAIKIPGTREGTKYFFNVVVMNNGTGLRSAYNGANVTYEAYSFDECVQDPDCQSQAQSNRTVTAVFVAVAAVFFALLIAVVSIKERMRVYMNEVYYKIRPSPARAGKGQQQGGQRAEPRPGQVTAAFSTAPGLGAAIAPATTASPPSQPTGGAGSVHRGNKPSAVSPAPQN